MIAITIDSLTFLAMVTNDECDLSDYLRSYHGLVEHTRHFMCRGSYYATERFQTWIISYIATIDYRGHVASYL